MTCTALGFKIGMTEGRYLHFEKISQLHKLIVLNFLQNTLDKVALMEGKKTPNFFSRTLEMFHFGAVEADYERKQTLQSQPRQEGWNQADASMKCDVQRDEINSLSCFGPL